MKQKPILVMILSVVALYCAVSWGVRAESPNSGTWEYKVISSYGPSLTNPPPNVNELNNAGYQGWELVAITAGEFPKVGSNQFRTDYYFKRAR